MTDQEFREYSARLRGLSDEEVLALLEQEMASGRDAHAAVAELEARERGLTWL